MSHIVVRKLYGEEEVDKVARSIGHKQSSSGHNYDRMYVCTIYSMLHVSMRICAHTQAHTVHMHTSVASACVKEQ